MATLAQARAALDQFKRQLPNAVLRGLRKGMPIALRLAKTKYMERKSNQHPFKVYDPANPIPGPLAIRQGNLVRTIRLGDMRFDGKRVKASLKAGTSDVRYAGVHEFGAIIRPRSGPYLVFPMGNAGGGYRIVRAKSVRIYPRPFLTPALLDAQPQIEKLVVAEIRQLARVTLKGIARLN